MLLPSMYRQLLFLLGTSSWRVVGSNPGQRRLCAPDVLGALAAAAAAAAVPVDACCFCFCFSFLCFLRRLLSGCPAGAPAGFRLLGCRRPPPSPARPDGPAMLRYGALRTAGNGADAEWGLFRKSRWEGESTEVHRPGRVGGFGLVASLQSLQRRSKGRTHLLRRV